MAESAAEASHVPSTQARIAIFLSAALNLQLLAPQEVIEAAQRACHDSAAPLDAVEGFTVQILPPQSNICR